MQQVGGLPGGSCTFWASEPAMTWCIGNRNTMRMSRPPPRFIRIDDWIYLESQTYGTIILDLERCPVIEILEESTVNTSTKWLRGHPEIEVVNRDRCGFCAKVAGQGAPASSTHSAPSHHRTDERIWSRDRQDLAVQCGKHLHRLSPATDTPRSSHNYKHRFDSTLGAIELARYRKASFGE